MQLKKTFWSRLVRHPWLMPYNRLAILVTAINVIIFADHPAEPAEVMNLVLWNFALAAWIRRQTVINLLFKIATSIPTSWPLSLRWAAGKVYHFGGIHVGAFFSGALWFVYLTAKVLNRSDGDEWFSYGPLAPVLVVHLLILTAMMIAALPRLRATYHNQFEIIGRFGSWISLALFWVQTWVLFKLQNPGAMRWHLLLTQYQTWVLVALLAMYLAPWLRLKKIPIEVLVPSKHVALTTFDYGVTPFPGSSTEISLSPLLEWHHFANIPAPGKSGFRLAISRAGDWTGRFIDKQPSHVWVKGIPCAGVGNVERLFKKVIWVATGSGIGPCVPHLLTGEIPSLLVWSTRDPEMTFGKEFVAELAAVQPNAIIWNTSSKGKPDLVALAVKALQDFGAEAVICIANKKTTWQVVYELESMGIPAFGAIWDS